MCYNVLCDKYCTRQIYGYCPSWALNWEYRKSAILKEILHYGADILSLQVMCRLRCLSNFPLKYTECSLFPVTFSVMCYNVLCDKYCTWQIYGYCMFCCLMRLVGNVVLAHHFVILDVIGFGTVEVVGKGGKIRETKTLNLLFKQHCMVTSFGSMFHLFHLVWSIFCTTKTFFAGWRKLLRKIEGGLLWVTNFAFFARFSWNSQLDMQLMGPSWIHTKQINQSFSMLYFFNLQELWFLGDVDHARWKMKNIDAKLATKQCCMTSWRFLSLLFCRLYPQLLQYQIQPHQVLQNGGPIFHYPPISCDNKTCIILYTLMESLKVFVSCVSPP